MESGLYDERHNGRMTDTHNAVYTTLSNEISVFTIFVQNALCVTQT